MIRLLLALLLLSLTGQAVAGGVIRDREFWSEGNYVASPGPWSLDAGVSVPPSDYLDVMALSNDGSFSLIYKWPAKTPVTGVYGYLYKAYGMYWQETVATPVASVQVGKLQRFNFTFDYIMSAPATANALAEFFVRAEPAKTGKLTAEIGFYLNMPPATRVWFKAGNLVGQFQNPGGSIWEIRLHQSGAAGLFYMIAPVDLGSRYAATNFDIMNAMKLLVGQPGVSADGWITGFALGFEPLGGTGGVLVNKFNVTMK